MFKKSNSFKRDSSNTVNIKCSIDIPVSKLELLNKHFGHSRFIYNWAIDFNTDRYKNNLQQYNFVNLAKELPKLKVVNPFLKEVDSTCLQQALQDYWTTMQHFYQKKCGLPKYRSKHSNQSFRIMNVTNSIRFEDNRIKLGKFGWVRIKPNQSIPDGTIQSATIKKAKSGKVYVTLTIRRADKIEQFDKTGKEVGIDIGINHFTSFSDGTVIEKPDFIKQDEKKKKRLYRQLSKKKKGSKNREKAKLKLAKFCEKDVNRREDFLHKLSLNIVREYDLIAVEHLNIKKMLMDKSLPYSKELHKSISELGWYSFISKLKYKSEWYGKTFIQVDIYYPSSQICSCCGYKNTEVKNLNIRNWVCPNCNIAHDRDFNASVNILNEGKRLLTA